VSEAVFWIEHSLELLEPLVDAREISTLPIGEPRIRVVPIVTADAGSLQSLTHGCMTGGQPRRGASADWFVPRDPPSERMFMTKTRALLVGSRPPRSG